MNIKVFVFILFIFLSTAIKSQDLDSLTLIDCYKLAKHNSPQTELFSIHQSVSDLNIDNYSTHNLPEMDVYGKAWYQSDAVSVPAQAPGAEGFAIDRFQYNFGFEVQQKLFDGGITDKKISLEKNSLSTQNAQTETSIYQIYSQINQLYFTILFMRENENILHNKSQTLDERIKIMESGVKNGVVLKSELEKLMAEKITLDQQILDIKYSIRTMNKNLSVLTGQEDYDNLRLSKNPDFLEPETAKRPEYVALVNREEQLSAMQELKTVSLIPKLYAYGQLGYSYPGLNFFENQSDPYYIVGLKLGWKIFDWNATRKEKEILEVQKGELSVQKKELDRNFLIAENAKIDEIEKINELIEKDHEIILARESITKSSSSALENGTITSADYLQDLDAETSARINLNKHVIQLMQNKAELMIIKGIEID